MTAFNLNRNNSSNENSGEFVFCVKDALETSNRGKLTRCLAEYKIVPVKNAWRNSSFGKSIANFERRGPKVGGNKHAFSTGVTRSVLSLLEISETEDIKKVREEIKAHPRWGASC